MTPSAGARALVVVLSLCDRLAAPRPLYPDVAAWLGVAGTDHRLRVPNAIGTPADDALTHAIVVADPATGFAAEVELWPALDATITPALLSATLGPAQRVPRAMLRPGEPPPLVHPVVRGERTLQVIAAVEDDRVQRLLVRR